MLPYVSHFLPRVAHRAKSSECLVGAFAPVPALGVVLVSVELREAAHDL